MFYIFCSRKIANSDSLGDAGVHEMVVGKDQRASVGMLPLYPHAKVVVQCLWRGASRVVSK